MALLDQRQLAQVGEQPSQPDGEAGEIAEPGPGQEVEGAHPEVGGHKDRSEEVPGAIQCRIPAERSAGELGARADAVPDEPEAPHELKAVPSVPPLVENERRKEEA